MQINIGHDGKAVLKINATERRKLVSGHTIAMLVGQHSGGRIGELAEIAGEALRKLLTQIDLEAEQRSQPADSQEK